MPIPQVFAISGKATKPDHRFTMTNKPGSYYKIVLKGKAWINFKMEVSQSNQDLESYPSLYLYNNKGKSVGGVSYEDGMSMLVNKGTYYLHFYAYGSDGKTDRNHRASAKITYHVQQLNKAKTINFKKANKGKSGSYYSILYKTTVKGVQRIDFTSKKHAMIVFHDGVPLGKNKDKDYDQHDNEIENCTAYFWVDSTAKNRTFSFKAKRKVLYKNFPLSFPDDGKVHNIKLNKKYYGHYNSTGEETVYKFTLKKAKKVSIVSSAFQSKKRMFAFDLVKTTKYRSALYLTRPITRKLKAGTYVLRCASIYKDNMDVLYHYDFTVIN